VVGELGGTESVELGAADDDPDQVRRHALDTLDDGVPRAAAGAGAWSRSHKVTLTAAVTPAGAR
jgi:hypothetical protein